MMAFVGCASLRYVVHFQVFGGHLEHSISIRVPAEGKLTTGPTERETHQVFIEVCFIGNEAGGALINLLPAA
jgi:hypothetical protein